MPTLAAAARRKELPPHHLLREEDIRCVSGIPLTGTPPSNEGGSHVMMAVSSPTDVHLTFSGGSGTSGEAGHREGHKRNICTPVVYFPTRTAWFSSSADSF